MIYSGHIFVQNIQREFFILYYAHLMTRKWFTKLEVTGVFDLISKKILEVEKLCKSANVCRFRETWKFVAAHHFHVWTN